MARVQSYAARGQRPAITGIIPQLALSCNRGGVGRTAVARSAAQPDPRLEGGLRFWHQMSPREGARSTPLLCVSIENSTTLVQTRSSLDVRSVLPYDEEQELQGVVTGAGQSQTG